MLKNLSKNIDILSFWSKEELDKLDKDMKIASDKFYDEFWRDY